MPIEVVCPNGHQLKLKDKYAGQTGLCPQCRARIKVPVPPLEDDEDLIDLVPRKQPLEPVESRDTFDPSAPDDYKDEPAEAGASHGESSAGESLLSSSIIRHQKVCPKCYQVAPIWYARCMNCDFFFRD